MYPTGSETDDFDLRQWLADSPLSLPENQGDTDGNTPGDDTWVLEICDRANLGPFLSTPTIAVDPNVVVEVVQILCATGNPPIEELPSRAPPLNPDIQNHLCRVFTALLRGLVYEAEAPNWGRIVSEMSHLVYQHIKVQSMGVSVPDAVFNRVRDTAVSRFARSLLRPEKAKWTPPGGNQAEIDISWGSSTFCKHVRLHLNEVVRTARESACKKARYFVCEEADHPGIVRSGLTDDDKRSLLSQMSFSAQYGCRILHQFKEDGNVVWFGNEDFAHLLQKSLYDITCPGWCGALDEIKDPDNDIVTVCQLTEVSAYTAASQITWLVHVARFYLETTLRVPTTFRPPKRRTGNSAQPTPNSPWLEWTDVLNSGVTSDIKTIQEFITELLAPRAVGEKMEEAFEIFRLYTRFIARPHSIPHRGSLGSFLHADPLPLLIHDQKLLNADC